MAQKHISRAVTSSYIPQYLWVVIICPYPWYMLLAQHSWCVGCTYVTARLYEVICYNRPRYHAIRMGFDDTRCCPTLKWYYNTLSISRGIFSSKNLENRPIASPLGQRVCHLWVLILSLLPDVLCSISCYIRTRYIEILRVYSIRLYHIDYACKKIHESAMQKCVCSKYICYGEWSLLSEVLVHLVLNGSWGGI